MKTMGDRLREARIAAGFGSARAAATRHGWTISTYSAHENGQNQYGESDAKEYAKRYKVLSGWLLTGEGPRTPPKQEDQEPRRKITEVPVLDWVSAGRLAEPNSQIPVEDVPLLAFADLGRGDFFALTVQGTSMDRISPDGSVIIVNRSDKQLVSGRPYVFAIRGEATYKIWQGGDPPYLEPSSWDAAHKPIFIKKAKDLEVVGRVRRTLKDL